MPSPLTWLLPPRYCDYCDLNGGEPMACMAADMLQQSRIADVVERQKKRRRRNSLTDPDGCEARHVCYKEVVAWQWANPLGAEQRVCLPKCVTCAVRRLFPNPKCNAAAGRCCPSRSHE